MHARTDIHTPFQIDLDWWERNSRSFDRFLSEMLGEPDNGQDPDAEMDFIDPETAEVFQVRALWAKVLTERAQRPDFISNTTPLTNAIFRALIENRNRPMTPMQIHRRINRVSPEALLRVLRTARIQYGIVPATE